MSLFYSTVTKEAVVDVATNRGSSRRDLVGPKVMNQEKKIKKETVYMLDTSDPTNRLKHCAI